MKIVFRLFLVYFILVNHSFAQTTFFSNQSDPVKIKIVELQKLYQIDQIRKNQLLSVGKISDQKNNVLKNMSFVIKDENGKIISSFKTNSKGHYSYTKLPIKNYKIELADNQKTVSEISLKDIELQISPITQVSFSSTDPKIAILAESDFHFLDKKNFIKAGYVKSVKPVEIALINKKGVLIKKLYTDAKGYFIFDKLPIHSDSLFIVANTLSTSNAWVTGNDPILFINTPQFKNFDFKKLPILNEGLHVSGKIISGDNVSLNDVTLLLLDENGKVCGKTKTNLHGLFKFDKLPAKNYTIVPEQTRKDLKIDSVFITDEPVFVLKQKDVFNYKKLPASEGKLLSIKGVIIGKVKEEELVDITLLLLDKEGSIISTTKSKKGGFYEFNKLLPNEYSVIVQSNNKNIKSKTQVFEAQAQNQDNRNESELIGTLYYELNEYIITNSNELLLNQYINEISSKSIYRIELNSYGDATGTIEYNLDLTQKRADTIKDFLIKKGIDKEKIIIHSFGKSVQFDSSTSENVSKLNRKTDIKIIQNN